MSFVLHKIPREKFDTDREEIWELADSAKPGKEKSRALLLALLSDIHTMLEHASVEPEEEE